MTTLELFSHGWNWNPYVLGGIAVAAAAYARWIGRRGRPGYFVAALALVAFSFLSPLNLLATGVLFTAHMAQHILLLLLVPGLLLLSLPANFSLPTRSGGVGRSARRRLETHRSPRITAMLGWAFGVGSMWFWHVPELCNAAAANPAVHTVQALSLLGLGAAFWWPILAPRAEARLIPGHGIIYLFTACLACTGLGILLTLTPVEVCPIFRAPSHAPAMWTALRDQLTPRRDQQIGGLLMWLPMCLVYVAAIVLELGRWLGEPAAPTNPAHKPS